VLECLVDQAFVAAAGIEQRGPGFGLARDGH
jgi:hypothetical protein